MLTRTRSRPISIRLWKRPGTTFIRRVPSKKSRSSAATAINRTSMIRLISNGVPTNHRGSGKNSPMAGPWNSPSLATIGTIRYAAEEGSVISSFGAWSLDSRVDEGGCGRSSRSASLGAPPRDHCHSTNSRPRDLIEGAGLSRLPVAGQLDIAHIRHARAHHDEDINHERGQYRGDDAHKEREVVEPRGIPKQVCDDEKDNELHEPSAQYHPEKYARKRRPTGKTVGKQDARCRQRHEHQADHRADNSTPQSGCSRENRPENTTNHEDGTAQRRRPHEGAAEHRG